MADLPEPPADDQWTFRQYLIAMAIAFGADPLSAVEAVASTAMEHPEWDMEEKKPLAEWVQER